MDTKTQSNEEAEELTDEVPPGYWQRLLAALRAAPAVDEDNGDDADPLL